MKKLTTLLLLLTLLSAGAWVTLKYSPQSIPFLKAKPKPEAVVASVTPEEYNAWRDSLDRIDLLVRAEQDPRVQRLYKDRQQYFWNKLKSAREQLVIADSLSTSHMATQAPHGDLVEWLSKILTYVAVGLLVLILILLLVLRKRRATLTRHLDELQEDDRFQGARSGASIEEPTRIPLRRPNPAAYTSSPNTLPDTASLDLTVLAQPRKDAGPQLRPTAKQRVTQALTGLAEALSALRSETKDSPQASKTNREKPMVKSQNQVRPTQAQVLAPTRFEREREENTEIVKLARRGFTSSEIARRLRVPQDQVETVIRLQRESD